MVFACELISGHLGIEVVPPGVEWAVPLALSPEDRAHRSFHGACAVGDRIVLLVYDVVRNTASGRRISRLSEGLDLHELEIGTRARLEPIVAADAFL